MAAPCKIELFGGLRVTVAGRVITRFRTEKTGALLGYLALHCPRAYPRDVLAELFWPEANAARHSLSTALSSLRLQLEPPGTPAGSVLLCDRQTVALNPAGVTLDVALFREALGRAARAGSPTERAQRWVDAVELYHGELLSGYWEDWMLGERQHLSSLFLKAAEGLVAHYEEPREYAEALEYAHQALRADPLREESHRHIIRLYAASGQPQLALEHYGQWTRTLERELDTLPDEATRALVREIELAGQRAAGAPARRETGARCGAGVPSERRGGRPTGRLRPRADLLSPPRYHGAATPAPNDTVTFLLADIEGASEIQARADEAFHMSLGEYRLLVRTELQRHNGREVRESAGCFTAAFASCVDAFQCAVAIQQAVSGRAWPAPVDSLPVRVTLHTGDVTGDAAEGAGGAYTRADAHAVLQTAARMLLAAHGGQILGSEATAALLRSRLQPDAKLVDLGPHHLAGDVVTERLFQVQYAGMPRAEFPPLKAEAAYVSNLPAQVTRFFGREEDVERLVALLCSPDTRLVTMIGPGGSGKTRLALEVAARLQEEFHGAVWFAPLAELRDARAIPDALLDTLKLPRSPGRDPLEQVVVTLTGRRALLLLDNLEQIAEEGAEVISGLMARLPMLTCLVTSRRVLEVPGERRFPIPPLPVPAGEEPPESLLGYASVRLFVDRAQAVRPDYQVTPANAATVAALCARLEGIPLALELVAARTQVMGPSQMLARLGERLDWQAGHARGTVDRHRTLRAAIDWSHRLLEPDLYHLFERLSVFRGGWSPEAAAALSDSDEPASTERVLEQLRELQSHSLVLSEEVAGEVRFRMLETLRDYAWECLTARGEAEKVCRRHAEFFLALAEEADANIQGGERQARLDQLDVEHDNLLAALSWCAGAAPDLEGRLASALGVFWEIRGHSSEGRRRLEAVLARGADLPEPVHAKVLLGAARLAWYQGDFARADTILQEALAEHRQGGDQEGVGTVLIALGDVAHRQSQIERACSLYGEGLALFRELEDTSGVALALYRLGMAVSDSGDHAAAVPILEEGLDTAKTDGDKATIAAVMSMLGHVSFRLGLFDVAGSYLEEALALAQEVGDLWATLFAEWSLGNMALVQGDVVRAETIFRDGMPKALPLANKWLMAYGLESFGYLAAARGQFEPAIRLFGSAAALREAIGAPLPPANRPDFERTVGGLRQALGEEFFARAWSLGRATPWEQAAVYALEGW